MSDLVTRQSLSTYLSELDAACDWLYSLGVQPHQTRFANYKNDLSEVLRHRIADTFHKLPAIVSVQRFLDAFIESGELIDIWKAFAGHSNGCVLRKIPAAVKGHPDPAHQKAVGPEPRDTLFELSVAAFFRSKGIPALLGKRTDVLLRSQGYTLLFECKRPRSHKGLKQSLKKASEQLQREIKRRKTRIFTRGVVALDVSLLIRRPGYFLDGRDAMTISTEIDTRVDEVRLKNNCLSETSLGRNVLGIYNFCPSACA
jgi:hypothetical protein